MQTASRLVWCFLIALTLLFCVQCYRTYRVFNDTVDESGHIACGLEIWQDGRYTLETQHPPLAHAVLGLPAYLAGLRQSEQQRRSNHHTLWTDPDPEFYWRTLSSARLGNLVFAPLLVVYLYLWGRRLYGAAAGLMAAALGAFCPNLLAHASLATLDFAAAVTTLASAYHFWRWAHSPSAGNCVAAAVAFAVAVLTKFSGFFFVPPIAAVFFLLARRGKQPWRSSAELRTALQRGALFLVIAALLIWAGYLFEVAPLPPAAIPPVEKTLGQYLESGLEVTIGRGSFPAPRFVRGVFDVLAHNARGHRCYLLGEVSQFGWWYYFPIALAVKTTLPLLALVAAAILLWAVQGRPDPSQSPRDPLVAAAVILGVSMYSSMNLGIRYILAIYPFFALIAAYLPHYIRAAELPARRLLVALVVLLGGWHVTESVRAHPDYLAYFNQVARGREERFLLDSNLDWGQDLERLRRYMKEKNIANIHLGYFGQTDPRVLGIVGARPLSPDVFPNGWVAVSKSRIGGVDPKGYRPGWVQGHTPVAQVGKSILVFYFPEGS